MAHRGWDGVRSSHPRRVTVTLECGHRCHTRFVPTDGAKFACPNNSGCGYQVQWLTAIDDHDRNFKNKKHPDNQEGQHEPPL